MPPEFVYPSLLVNVLSYTFLTSIMVFSTSFQITRTIATGERAPLKMTALAKLPSFLHPICVDKGQRRLFSFTLFSFLFPGILVLIFLHILSFIVNGPAYALHWRMSLQNYLGYTSLWRLFISACVFTVNYIAAHNPSQDIFIPVPDSQ
ncbi:hypothetical protein STCU_01382 [Strigomonas culicis]|nr:hypothetical protein STCU_01382 [Strigomonas culicis]|eukprot:EPY34720.1 hypothetical protein STCU_01382 [Strigomonas culicis]